jgi:biopolymer transport protein ExbD
MAAKLSGPGNTGKSYTVEQNADINVTPFVDIMLVLLIIFMVSIPMATVSIKLDMPPPLPPNPNEHPKPPVFIMIDKTGAIYVTRDTPKLVTLDELPGELGAELKVNNPEVADPRMNSVFVKADADTKYEQFMDVLNKLEDTGYFKIGLITEDIT